MFKRQVISAFHQPALLHHPLGFGHPAPCTDAWGHQHTQGTWRAICTHPLEAHQLLDVRKVEYLLSYFLLLSFFDKLHSSDICSLPCSGHQ